jgi:hypothetical protein
MGGKGNAKGTKAAGKGKSTYTGGNRGGGVTKKLTDILDGSSDDSDEDSLLSLIAGDDGKVEGATRKLALAAVLKKKDGSSSGTTKIEVTPTQLAKIKKMMKKEKDVKREKRDAQNNERFIAALRSQGLLRESTDKGDTGTQKTKKAKHTKPSSKDADDDDDDDESDDDGDDEEVPPKKPRLSRVAKLKKRLDDMEGENKELTAHLSALVGRPMTGAEGLLSYSDGEIDDSPAKRTRQSKRAIMAARMLLRKSPYQSPAATPKPSPKATRRVVLKEPESERKETVEETPTKMSCAELMAMAKNRCGTKTKTFHTSTKKQKAQALLDSLSGAIRMVVNSNPGADFTGKAPPAFEEHLKVETLR